MDVERIPVRQNNSSKQNNYFDLQQSLPYQQSLVESFPLQISYLIGAEKQSPTQDSLNQLDSKGIDQENSKQQEKQNTILQQQGISGNQIQQDQANMKQLKLSSSSPTTLNQISIQSDPVNSLQQNEKTNSKVMLMKSKCLSEELKSYSYESSSDFVNLDEVQRSEVIYSERRRTIKEQLENENEISKSDSLRYQKSDINKVKKQLHFQNQDQINQINESIEEDFSKSSLGQYEINYDQKKKGRNKQIFNGKKLEEQEEEQQQQQGNTNINEYNELSLKYQAIDHEKRADTPSFSQEINYELRDQFSQSKQRQTQSSRRSNYSTKKHSDYDSGEQKTKSEETEGDEQNNQAIERIEFRKFEEILKEVEIQKPKIKSKKKYIDYIKFQSKEEESQININNENTENKLNGEIQYEDTLDEIERLTQELRQGCQRVNWYKNQYINNLNSLDIQYQQLHQEQLELEEQKQQQAQLFNADWRLIQKLQSSKGNTKGDVTSEAKWLIKYKEEVKSLRDKLGRLQFESKIKIQELQLMLSNSNKKNKQLKDEIKQKNGNGQIKSVEDEQVKSQENEAEGQGIEEMNPKQISEKVTSKQNKNNSNHKIEDNKNDKKYKQMNQPKVVNNSKDKKLERNYKKESEMLSKKENQRGPYKQKSPPQKGHQVNSGAENISKKERINTIPNFKTVKNKDKYSFPKKNNEFLNSQRFSISRNFKKAEEYPAVQQKLNEGNEGQITKKICSLEDQKSIISNLIFSNDKAQKRFVSSQNSSLPASRKQRDSDGKICDELIGRIVEEEEQFKQGKTLQETIGNICLENIGERIEINELNSFQNSHYQQEYFSITDKLIIPSFQKNENDGSVTSIFKNKIQKTEYKDNTTIYIFPSGYQLIFFSNGDIKQLLPNGIQLYFYKSNQSTQTTIPGGTEIILFNNKQIELLLPNGEKQIQFPDETIQIISINGKQKSIDPIE